MKEDKILKMFFEPERWQYAISKGVDKDISKAQLYQLCKPEARIAMYEAIRDGRYRICPPHTAKIPKDNGDFRTVYVNEPIDRIFLSIANDLLFELTPYLVHERCKSYLKGMSCGRAVQEVSRIVCSHEGVIGWKSDLSKYFDSVPLRYIDEMFDKVEIDHGKSRIIDVIRDYYHSDLYFDEDNNLCEAYQSLKQGCAVAAWLADVILYHIDERMSKRFGGYYIRYSDDMLFLGERYTEAMDGLRSYLNEMKMTLNPKKVEYLDKQHWFKFLGFAIRGSDISLPKSRLKKFQKEIEARTIKDRETTPTKAINAVNKYLYKGYDGFSWATLVLPVINVKKDIDTMNGFVMDCIRAVMTDKHKIGGLGFVKDQKEGCVTRGKGKNVRANRDKTGARIEGYKSLGCMRNALLTSRDAYNTLVANL